MTTNPLALEAAPAGTPHTWRPRPWAAGVLTVLTPGLGQVYNGRPIRALATWLVFNLALLLFVLAATLKPPALRFSFVLALPLWVVVIRDAVLTARRTPAGRRLWFQRWYSLVGLLVVFVFAVDPGSLYVRGIARGFRIPSGSMEPTIREGEYIMAAHRVPHPIPRQAIVLFADESEQYFLGRVVGTPGDTLAMRNSTLFINGVAVPEPYVAATPSLSGGGGTPSDFAWQERYRVHRAGEPPPTPTASTWGPLITPESHYFVLGDNRPNSLDSRYRGFISRERIRGKAAWIYFSRDPHSGTIRWSRIGDWIE